MKKLLRNRTFLVFTGVVIGLIVGWLIFRSGSESDHTSTVEEESTGKIWTCSMHPQIRQNEPGQCPICGMDLIPLEDGGRGMGMVEMTEEAAKLANIQVVQVGYSQPEKEILLQGKVTIDERRISSQTAHIPGRIERLHVKFTGEEVRRGQKLATIYSPELVSAQRELLEATKNKVASPALYQAARRKLQYWKLTEKQIDRIEELGEVSPLMDVYAEISGIVQQRKVAVGDYVKEGQMLFSIANLDKVWVEFDAYESDLPWIKEGQELTFAVSSLAGLDYTRKITFIDPVVNAKTRTAKVRTEVNNSNGRLKPEMFTESRIKTRLARQTDQLTVPKTAVLWTGKRSVVYVQPPQSSKPLFEFREVTLGPDLGDAYVILDGLAEGEWVVVNGVFKVDAAAQLAGLKSMMNKQGGQVMRGHDHGDGTVTSSESKPISGGRMEVFEVSGNCGMCKERIEKAALSMDGVMHASWNEKTKQLQLHMRDAKVDLELVAKAIAKAGHDNEYVKADPETYGKLAPCCRYSRE